ncbi:L,D-transpeptidase [Acidiphilium sp.]|uniref:L,D-transpeptidase n=1 Tax=Acidiphilium sp. TaxID=527 RepID=UPI003D02DE72
MKSSPYRHVPINSSRDGHGHIAACPRRHHPVAMLTNHQFHHLLTRDFSLHAQAERLHALGYLPCRPGFTLDHRGYLGIDCVFRGAIPPGLAQVPATALIRGAYVAWKHDTVLGFARKAGPAPFRFTWVAVSKDNPAETATIWQRDRNRAIWHIALRSLVNTGIDHATPDGSWPIVWRLKSARMKGVTPTGSHYDVRAVPWVNYFHGNDALHGFARAAYGFPQSAGCVELPVPIAKHAFTLLHDGAIVTITGHWHPGEGYAPSSSAALLAAAPRAPARPFPTQTPAAYRVAGAARTAASSLFRPAPQQP